MNKHCCRCWRCVDDNHDVEICFDCTLEELELRVASKGIAFISVSDYEVKGGEDPRWN
jgi:uncharacterized UBP type Zn finger protein